MPQTLQLSIQRRAEIGTAMRKPRVCAEHICPQACRFSPASRTQLAWQHVHATVPNVSVLSSQYSVRRLKATDIEQVANIWRQVVHTSLFSKLDASFKNTLTCDVVPTCKPRK